MQVTRFLRASLPIALLAVCALATQAARAVYVSGSFSGIAQADPLPLGFEPPRPESYYDGALVTGSFGAFVPDPQFQVGGADYAYFLNGNGGWLSLSYTIKDAHFDFFVGTPDPSSAGLPSVLLLNAPSDSNPFQTVLFLTDFMPKYDGASFELRGPAGSLFDGLDASTLRFDAANPPLFSTGFASSSAAMRIAVDVRQVVFQTTPVPEPETCALMLAGLGAVGWAVRRGFGPPSSLTGRPPSAA
jgi:hypothetical protein